VHTYFDPMKGSASYCRKRGWFAVCGYLLILFIVTPYLPLLIKWAQARWKAGSAPSFVFAAEICMGILLLVLACSIFFFKRRRFLFYISVIAAILGVSSLFYYLNPNPYELTHIPEYAILSILLTQTTTGGEVKGKIVPHRLSLYLKPGVITLVVGAVDELYQGLLASRYFNWYDIALNGVGGILGLTIYWGMKRG
jgi:VanZ family protein